MANQPRPAADGGPLPEELERFVRERLGPCCALRFGEPAARAELARRLAAGAAVEDAALGLAHRLALEDRQVADEFLAHFLDAMMRVGHLQLGPALRRYLDTGDLVQSVLGGLWRELAAVEFRTRAEFLSYLGRRLGWKASDRARGLNSERRREDRRSDEDPAELAAPPRAAGPPTLAGDREEWRRLCLVLPRLPERERLILGLLLREADRAEIGRLLGLQPAATRKAIQRALERARWMLG